MQHQWQLQQLARATSKRWPDARTMLPHMQPDSTPVREPVVTRPSLYRDESPGDRRRRGSTYKQLHYDRDATERAGADCPSLYTLGGRGHGMLMAMLMAELELA